MFFFVIVIKVHLCNLVDVRVTEISQDGFVIPIEKQHKGLCPGAKLDVYFPGFPTLKHLKHTVYSAAVISSCLAAVILMSCGSPIHAFVSPSVLYQLLTRKQIGVGRPKLV